MYSGVDGRELEADIFVGIVYYQRLRHMVSDKFQVSGPIHYLMKNIFLLLYNGPYICCKNNIVYIIAKSCIFYNVKTWKIMMVTYFHFETTKMSLTMFHKKVVQLTKENRTFPLNP